MRSAYIASLAALLMTAACAGCGNRAQRPPHEPPIGVVEAPAAGAILRPGFTLVGGWAVSDSGVREVRVYFDDGFKALATVAVPRPDVSKAMPRYAKSGDLHGWNLLVDFGLAAGNHTIRVEAVASDGMVKNIGIIPVTVPY